MPSRVVVFTIFMMVFGMTRQGREPTAYRMRGGHYNTITITPWYIFQYITHTCVWVCALYSCVCVWVCALYSCVCVWVCALYSCVCVSVCALFMRVCECARSIHACVCGWCCSTLGSRLLMVGVMWMLMAMLGMQTVAAQPSLLELCLDPAYAFTDCRYDVR